jgi:hypothetical protein
VGCDVPRENFSIVLFELGVIVLLDDAVSWQDSVTFVVNE